jgi:chromosome segregation protein
MQLKSLEMHGFKSFADRTEFKFDPGITGIVGPNGCGKSNVVDAIKWVLGDLSAKSIRGEEMLDCLFNGASSRQPSGFAEVSLTFDNSDAKLPTPYSEVTVTRRLFRSGESEYLINKQPMRRKDIIDMFMDTGVGTDAYSIIEQGRIAVVLEASPRDRRALIDEAAGISRYRARKKESMSRLERVQQDLLRLGDTLKELETQIRSLKIQAGKAERYVKLKDEWKDKRTALALLSFDQLRARAAAVAAQLADFEAERTRIAESIESLRNEEAVARRAREEADAAYVAASGRREAAAKEADGCRASIEDSAALASHMEEQSRQAAENASARRAEVVELQGAEEEARGRLEEAGRELDRIAGEIESRRDAWQALARAVSAIGEERTSNEREAVEAMGRRAEVRNQTVEVEAHRAHLESQRARAAEKRSRLAGDVGELDRRLADVVAAKSAIDGELAGAKEAYGAAERAHVAAREANAEAARALGARREEHARTAAKLETLKEIERQMDGVGAGARKLIEAARKGHAPAGFRGLVADLVEFDPTTALAAEALLGDRAQAAIFDTDAQVRAALEAGGGRIALLSLERLRSAIADRAAALGAAGAAFEPTRLEAGRGAEELEAAAAGLDADFQPGSHGWPVEALASEQASDEDLFARFAAPTGPELVEQLFPDNPPSGRLADAARCAPEFRALAEALCGKARITAKRERALALLAEGVLDAPVATLDGDIVHPDGLVVAGGARAGLIRRRAEARALAGEIEKLSAEVKSLEEARIARTAEENAASDACTDLRHRIYDRSKDSGEKSKELQGLEARLNVARGELELIESEDAEARQQQVRLAGKAERLALLVVEVEGLLVRLTAEGEALREKSVAAKAARDAAEARVHELDVQQAETSARRDGAAAEVKALADRIRGAETAAAQAQARIAEFEQRHCAALRQVEERRARLADLERSLTAASRDAEEAGAAREAASGEAARAAKRRGEAEEELRAAEAELGRLRIEEDRARNAEQNLVDRFRDDIGVDLREAEKTLARDPNASPETLSTEVEEIRRRLDNLGGVNPEAIHELKTVEERYAYLKGQEQDLTASKAQLEDLIRKINRESRELFAATLEQTRINFNEMFRKLFGGGKAEIVCEEGEDILECGIDLMAKPPGKEPATISQLSGGEKTLTVLAFIMALFQLKPSPFCILDEVDAPLDEANVERFNGLIRDFAGGTQFIVITHNKKTMAAVRALYGVTMQEKGISKKVSVKVVDEELPAEPAMAGA